MACEFRGHVNLHLRFDMFEFLFKYPRAVFSKGDLVLLGAWPKWVFVLFVLAAGAGLAWLIRSKLPRGVARK